MNMLNVAKAAAVARCRARYRAQGFCTSCPTPVAEGKTMCAKHLAALRARNYARYRAEGRRLRRAA